MAKVFRNIVAGFALVTASLVIAQTVPINGVRTAGFFDSKYAKEQKVQHLGVDISAPEKSDVRSPVDGTVLINNTWTPDVMQAYIVIKSSNGEHVLGHIASNLAMGAKVKRNQIIGKVRPWPGNSHVHWGINTIGVTQAMVGKWGWGRAPLAATVKDATDKGWLKF